MTDPAVRLNRGVEFLSGSVPGHELTFDDVFACAYTGAHNLEEFHDRAVVGIQSAAGYTEGKPRQVD